MIYASLDDPAEDSVVSRRLFVSGWATSAGETIARVECWIDDALIAAFRLQYNRPDVLASAAPGAVDPCGFAGHLDLELVQPGPHVLRVVVWDESYNHRAFERRFTRRDGATLESSSDRTSVRALAFYLPQYHPIPENNAWWGPGFTEWTNVARARPLFVGHHQPRVPADLGFYDLRLPETRLAQAELARSYGIHGFVYYHYWFNGKRLLELPFREVLESGSPRFPFCVCYANENWTRRWDGLESEVLQAQAHSPEDDRAFIRDLLPAFADPRYIRIDGRPLLIVYRPALFPDVRRTAELYRSTCVEAGEREPYLAYVQSFADMSPESIGFDAAIEFPPLGFDVPARAHRTSLLVPEFRGGLLDYEAIIEAVLDRPAPDYTFFRGVMPAWDNSARRGERGFVFVQSSPEGYRRWLSGSADWTVRHRRTEERLVFVNAWNEWGEGCYLEPDQKYGRLYLEATAEALQVRVPAFVRRVPETMVVVPSYNHERFIGKALGSIVDQTRTDVQALMIDDGSTDGTIAAATNFVRLRGVGDRVTIRAQANAGAHIALRRGVEETQSRYVAILNSDDAFELERLDVMIEALEREGADLAFSRVRYYDETERDLTHVDGYAMTLWAKQIEARSFPSIEYALLDFNISISTGNFVFRRSLYERIGGFAPMVLTHDWDFVLTAARLGSVIFVEDDLYRYRLHGTNSFRGYGAFGAMEGRIVMENFFRDKATVLKLFEASPAYYRDFVKRRSLEGYGAFAHVPPEEVAS